MKILASARGALQTRCTTPMTCLPSRLLSSLCIAVLSLLLCPASFSAEPPWLEVHSTHFTMTLGKERLNQSVPLTILAFKNDKTYYQVALLRQGQPIDVPGFFLPGDD